MSGVGTDPVELLTEALRIYSPSGEEAELASYLCTQMKSLGYTKVRLDEAGNAIGEVGSGAPDVLLCGHMDTVPGELPVKNENGVLWGRGAADAKSPLCALMLAGARAADAGVRVTFVGATREEGDSLGIQTLIKSGAKYRFAVFGEPSGANRVTIGYRGRVSMHVVLETEGGHAGSPWAHTSALSELYSVIKALEKYETQHAAADHFRSLSILPTLAKAGTYHNVVPPVCEATFDIRIPPGVSSSDAEKAIESLVHRSVKSSTSVSVEFGTATEAYEVEPDSVLTRAFQRAVILKAKTRPVMVRKTGTGDMNTLAASMSVQCVTYGPGDPRLSHTAREAVPVADYLKSIDVLEEVVRQVKVLSPRA